MQYKQITGTSSILGIEDNGTHLHIPNDSGNRHWQAYQAWLAEGNEPDPADEE